MEKGDSLEDCAKEIWERYTGQKTGQAGAPKADPVKADRALVYMERIVDRQLNKVRGILSFNSLLLAAIKLSRDPTNGWLGLVIMLVCVGSCAVLLWLLFVRWSTKDIYADFEAEFLHTAKLCAHRSKLITVAICASGFSVALLSLMTGLEVFGARGSCPATTSEVVLPASSAASPVSMGPS